MDYAFLKQLLERAEEFERQHSTANGPPDVATFAAWLHGRSAASESVQDPGTPSLVPGMTPEAEIGKLLIFLTRYARSYIRQGLAGTPLLTPDDFAYLATVLGHQPLSKTELITRNVHEKPSGNEVIKRLLARGLVQEQPHATDRRSKLLTITEAGQDVLFQVFGRMDQAAQLIAGDLTPPERAQLLHLLQKLDAFHQPIYASPRASSFQELLQWLPTTPEQS